MGLATALVTPLRAQAIMQFSTVTAHAHQTSGTAEKSEGSLLSLSDTWPRFDLHPSVL